MKAMLMQIFQPLITAWITSQVKKLQKSIDKRQAKLDKKVKNLETMWKDEHEDVF